MPKRILMVDADASLRRQAARSLTTRGYEFQENPDGRDVLEQVRTFLPQVLILNVELPRGSGYAVCSKLRKDEGLKAIKVLLTSAEATQKAFDDHKKLKLGRADDYLLKPFEVDELSRKVVALLGDEFEPEVEAPEAPADLAFDSGEQAVEGEERISLDDIEEISVDEELGPSDSSLPGERDVDLLDSAFQRLEDPSPESGTSDDTGLNGNGGPEPLSLDEPLEQDLPSPLHEQANEVLQALESEPEERTVVAGHPRPMTYPSRRDEQSSGDGELLRLRDELNARGKELLEQRDRETLLENEVARRKEELSRRDGQIRQLQQRIDALIAGQRRGEKDLQVSREEARAAAQRAEAAERARSTTEGQQRQQDQSVERLSAELESARQRFDDLQADADRLRSRNEELEAETNELRGHRAELEDEKHKNEERLVKSYERLQEGERIRGKTKQALTLALQLLDESGESDEPENEDRP